MSISDGERANVQAGAQADAQANENAAAHDVSHFDGTQWSAVARAAAAARKLNRTIAARQLDDSAAAAIADVLETAVERLGVTEPRNKLDDMLSRPYLREIYQDKLFPLPLEVGDEIEFDPFSLVGGALHPASLDLKFYKESDDSVTGVCSVDPAFAGPPERTHGGVMAMVFDEVMGALNRMRGHKGFTAWLRVDYRAATPLGTPLTLRGWVHSIERRKITLRATCHADGELTCEAEGLFVMPREQYADGETAS